MVEKPSRLGRGLAALIGDMAPPEASRVTQFPSPTGPRRVAVDLIGPNPNNPRRDFDPGQLEELTASIREKGVMAPLLVRPSPSRRDGYELIAGERRWRAAQRAGLHEVPVVIREVDDREALELAIIENVQRADLSPLEEAQGYEQLLEQFQYTQNDLAQVIGKSRSHVANTLRLLKLPEDVRGMLARGEMTAGHARTLITAEDPTALAQEIVSGGLSVREAEALTQKRPTPEKPKAERKTKDADTVSLERRVSDALGLAVALDHKGEGGRLEIRYASLEQLDALVARLTGSR